MKQTIFLLVIMVTLIASMFMIGCGGETEHEKMRREYNKNIFYAEVIDSAGIKASNFKYNNHDFIMFISFDGTSVVHSPDCKHCLNIFD